jgi:hypothetical protein
VHQCQTRGVCEEVLVDSQPGKVLCSLVYLVRCEATRTDQARVVWGRSVRIDETTGARVNAITANQQSAAVREGGNHALRTALQIGKLLVKGDLDSLLLGLLTQHLVQARSQEIDAWGSHFRPGPITNLAKRLAVPAPAHHARNRRSLA